MARAIGDNKPYSKKAKKKVLQLITEGVSVRKIAQMDDMPSKKTIHWWITTDKDWGDRYSKAKEISAEIYAENAMDYAQSLMAKAINGKADKVLVQATKTILDATKWYTCHNKPKVYGKRIDVTSDSNGEQKVTVEYV
ncbi:MAG: hypothetical protein V3V61_01070 [Gammaproteobacteria bacterium]